MLWPAFTAKASVRSFQADRVIAIQNFFSSQN